MNSTMYNDNLFQEKSHSLSGSNNNLFSLLGQPLMCSDNTQVELECQQMSFYEPFDDPDMEPLPLGPSKSSTCFPPVSKSMFDEDESNQQETVKPDLSESLYRILFPNENGNKRTFDDMFTSDSTPLHKRQRTIPRATSDETVMRFRPYQEKQWVGMYRKLVEYKHKNGHCCVPHSYKEDPMLARWVKRQRYQRKKFDDNDTTSTMTSHRIQQLESIGFVWHSHASAWQTKFNELQAFHHRTGHCDVPSNTVENAALSTWVRSQRRQYHLWKTGCQSTMTTQRFDQLASLGFSFENKSGAKNQESI